MNATTLPQESTTRELRDRWSNPTDIFTVLLVVGGDVVQRALAQLVGTGIVPVPFSFGWVSYAMSAFLAAIGDNKLMPAPEAPSLVIPAQTGYVRNNQSWILGRVLRDFEHWMDEEIDNEDNKKLAALRKQKRTEAEQAHEEYNGEDVRIGLRLSVYEADPTQHAGRPCRDRVWWTSIVVIFLQLGTSIVPFVLYHDWTVLFVTAAGSLLALACGRLPQWRDEKWACRRETWKIVTLTAGNGQKDCIVILGNGCGLDLEDLATSRRVTKNTTRFALGLFSLGWIVLLISVAGFSQHTWYLIGVGGIGTIDNIIIAGVARKPKAFGIHLKYKEVILDRKVMDVLAEAERRYPHLGKSLLQTFFPGALRDREKAFWDYANRRASHFDAHWARDHSAEPGPLPSLRGDDKIPKDSLL